MNCTTLRRPVYRNYRFSNETLQQSVEFYDVVMASTSCCCSMTCGCRNTIVRGSCDVPQFIWEKTTIYFLSFFLYFLLYFFVCDMHVCPSQWTYIIYLYEHIYLCICHLLGKSSSDIHENKSQVCWKSEMNFTRCH
jgi:cell division protein FtsW (lipid II flippase)